MSNQPTPIARLVTVCLFTALLGACSQTIPQPTASSTPTPSAISTAAPTGVPGPTANIAYDAVVLKSSIQQTLDIYAQAYNRNDPVLLQRAIDQDSGPFRRLVRGRFDTFQESALNTAYQPFQFRVETVEPLEQGFVRAQIVENSGWASDWTFREAGGRWLLSEPSRAQVGERVTQESEHFTFYTYPLADEVNSDVIALMEEARGVVERRLGKVPEQKALVDILPIFGIGPPQSSNTAAFYARSSNQRNLDRIVIYAPRTFSFGSYDPAEGWQPSLRQTLVHEYTNLVNNRSFTPLVRLPMWMTEGLAEYVSDSSRAGEVAAAVRADAVIPLIDPDPVNAAFPQDLQHLGTLERDVSLAYGLSYSLVDYIAENYGGLDGFWKLAAAYDQSQRLPDALEAAFGVSYEQFDQGWRAWLEQKY